MEGVRRGRVRDAHTQIRLGEKRQMLQSFLALILLLFDILRI